MVTPSALYSLQVAYLRAGLLDAVKGRGPGSGVQASSKTLAQFLIALATNASSKENVRDAKALAKARPLMNNECPLTKTKTTFVDALVRLLTDESLASRVNEVDIGSGQAMIRYDGAHWKEGPERWAAKPPVNSIFVARVPNRGLRFSASISGDNLLALAKVLK